MNFFLTLLFRFVIANARRLLLMLWRLATIKKLSMKLTEMLNRIRQLEVFACHCDCATDYNSLLQENLQSLGSAGDGIDVVKGTSFFISSFLAYPTPLSRNCVGFKFTYSRCVATIDRRAVKELYQILSTRIVIKELL